MKKCFSSKRGNIFVIGIMSLVLLLVLAMFFITAAPRVKDVYDTGIDIVETDRGKEILRDSKSDYDDFWDGAFLWVFGAFWLAALIVGYQSDYGKFIMVIMMLLMIGLCFVAGSLTDYWVDASDDPDRATSADYPNVYLIMDNFLLVFILMMATAFFVYYTGDFAK